ncbi:g46 [Coccomyxa elongata]
MAHINLLTQRGVPQAATQLRPCPARAFQPVKRGGRSLRVLTVSQIPQSEATRREALIATGGAVLLAGLQPFLARPALADGLVRKTIETGNLTTFQKSAQKEAFRVRAEGELKKVLTAEDAPATLRLALHDAATFDINTGTGGLNGSIVLSEELNRKENESLKPIVQKLQSAKDAIDAGNAKRGMEPITWADLIVLGAKVAALKQWFAAKKARLGPGADIDTISSAFGADWPVVLGRVDSTTPDTAGRVPDPATASVQEVRAFLRTLGTKEGAGGGPFAPKPLLWERPAFVLWCAAQDDPQKAEQDFAAADPQFAELKQKYDRSRKTVTRTDYEVDFIDFFTRLTGPRVGAKFNPVAYLTPINIELPKL